MTVNRSRTRVNITAQPGLRRAQRPRRFSRLTGRCYRRAGQEAAQVVGQGAALGVAPGGTFFQALQADRLQVARHLRLQPAGRHRLLGDDLHRGVQRRGRLERRPAGQQLVEDGAQGVDVGGRADGPSCPRPAPEPCSWACPGWPRCGVVAPGTRRARLARPKSVILGVPSSVSRTLAGFRSRWMMPCSWATASPGPASRPVRAASRGGQRRAGQLFGQAAAVDSIPGRRTAGPRARRPRRSARCWGAASGRWPPPRC